MPDDERPVYMLIFNDLLKRHHDAQPKFVPPPESVTAKLAEKPSLSYSNKSQPSATAGRVSSTATSARTAASQQKRASRQSSVSTPSQQSHVSSSAPDSLALALPRLSEQANLGTVVGSAAPGGGGGSGPPPRAIGLPRPGVLAEPGLSQSIMTMKNPQDQPMAPAVQTAMALAGQQLQQAQQQQPPVANRQHQNSPAVRPEATEHQAPLVAGKLSLGLNHPIAIQTKTSSSAPSVGHAPKAAIGTQPGPNQQVRDGTGRGGGNYPSLARTIAEQTPHAFRTLGPGFNTGAPAEKSLNPSSNTLAGAVVPSDYEHIFHAPSQISDLPTRKTTTTNQQTGKRHRPSTSSKAARTAQPKTRPKSKQHSSKGKHSHDTGARKRS